MLRDAFGLLVRELPWMRILLYCLIPVAVVTLGKFLKGLKLMQRRNQNSWKV